MRRVIALAAALLALAGCMNKEKEKDPERPAKLVNVHPTLRVQHIWSDNIGGDKTPLRLGLGLAVEGDRVFAAGRKGDVAAYALTSGRQIWHVRTKAPLGGATAVGAGLVIVGSTDGDVIALDAASGHQKWRVLINSEILSAPTIASHAVIVRSGDGRLRGLALENGKEIWQQEQAVPRLSLRGVARPTVAGDIAICGFDNGKVVAVNANDGTVSWETPVAPPKGRTELERLVDIDSAVRVAEQDVYAVGFQGKVAMLSLETGQVWWSHDASSYRALGLDDDNLYMTSADGEVSALTRRTGAVVWDQKVLLNRGLSAPALSDTDVIIADYQGYVHFLDKATGNLSARVSTSKVRISNPPVVAGNIVVVINDRGHLFAYRVTALPGHAKAAPAKAASEPAPPPAPPPTPQPAPQPSAPATDSSSTPPPQGQ
jgi:outer membrane protein assembly factor BamB